MEKPGQTNILATILSVAYLLAAICLIFLVCSVCYPQAGEKLRMAMTGWEGGVFRTAFHHLADGLEQGEPIREVFSQTVELLLPQ